jgi:hypothetical protein
MARHLGRLETRFLIATLTRLAICGAVLAMVCMASLAWIFPDLSRMHFMPKLAGLLGTIIAAAGLFFTTAYFLKIDEVEDAIRIVQRKFSRSAAK